MMKKKYLVLLLCCLLSGSFLLSSQENSRDSDLTTLRNLIQSSEKNLKQQQQLLSFLVEYDKVYKDFSTDSNNREKSSILITLANNINTLIKNLHLNSIFSEQTTKELTFFSQFANNQTISTP